MKQKSQEVILGILVRNRKAKASPTRRRACQAKLLAELGY